MKESQWLLSYFQEYFIWLTAYISSLKGAVDLSFIAHKLIDLPHPQLKLNYSLQEQLSHCMQDKLNLANGTYES